jgi:hypothetical protein
MSIITDKQWVAYRLWHPDHQGLSYEETAKEMGLRPDQVERLLKNMMKKEPSLFVDISSDGLPMGRGMSHYRPGVDGLVKSKW